MKTLIAALLFLILLTLLGMPEAAILGFWGMFFVAIAWVAVYAFAFLAVWWRNASDTTRARFGLIGFWSFSVVGLAILSAL